MSHFTIPFPASTYTARRQQLMQTVGASQILLLGNDESSINFKDNWYRFRQDSSFLYYLGLNLPQLAAILDGVSGETWLFGDDPSMDDIVWIGNQASLASWGEKVGITRVFRRDQLPEKLSRTAHFLPPYRAAQQVQLQALLETQNLQASQVLIKAIVAQRNKKTAEELVEIEHAVSLTAQMHERVLKAARTGQKEYELVAKASQFAWAQGGHWSFPPILTTQGQTLHNHYYGNTLQADDMVLFDGGIEVASGYCGDMTRTFPVGAQFTSLQKDLYTIVHRAYLEARAVARPGTLFKAVHLTACQTLVEGLVELGWMKGDPSEAVAAGAHTLFFQCGLGHMMGLDVHDMENLGEAYVGYDETVQKATEFGLKSLRLGRALEAGFVITIEPGIYVIPELIDQWVATNKCASFINYEVLQKHRDAGGIRIEDDFVVTATGVRQLGTPLVTERSAIEAMRREMLS